MKRRGFQGILIVAVAGLTLGAAARQFSAIRGVRNSFAGSMERAAERRGVPVGDELTIVSDPGVLTISVPVEFEEFPVADFRGRDLGFLYIEPAVAGGGPVAEPGFYIRSVYADLFASFPVSPTCVELIDDNGNVAAVLDGTHEFIPGIALPPGDMRAKECDPASCGSVGDEWCCTQSCSYTSINEVCVYSDCIQVPDSGGGTRESCRDF